jgi:hypothetical protein
VLSSAPPPFLEQVGATRLWFPAATVDPHQALPAAGDQPGVIAGREQRGAGDGAGRTGGVAVGDNSRPTSGVVVNAHGRSGHPLGQSGGSQAHAHREVVVHPASLGDSDADVARLGRLVREGGQLREQARVARQLQPALLDQDANGAESVLLRLFALAATHQNVHIVDWDAAVQADGTLTSSPTSGGDDIHPVPKGQKWIADHTKAAVTSCNLAKSP